MDHAKPGNQENSAVALPSWWRRKIRWRPSHPKKDKHVHSGMLWFTFRYWFKLTCSWKTTGSHPHASRLSPNLFYFPVGTNNVLSGMGWCGQSCSRRKEFFLSILHNVGSMTKNLCKSFKSCCTKIASKDLATSNDKALKSRRQKMVDCTASDHCENSKTSHSQKTVLLDLPFENALDVLRSFWS